MGGRGDPGTGRHGERGQSAPIAVILLLGLAILGATAVVALGGAAIDGTEGRSELARAEQSMTLFDSQAAQVALGEADSQSVEFGYVNGDYRVDDSAGEISIVQLDCDDDDPSDPGAGYDPVTNTLSSDDEFVLSPTDLGTVLYERDGTTIGYQGGGVWKERQDGSVMVSPPEFHFRGQTLTLPVIETRGSGSIGGSATASITEGVRADPVFPNVSDSFDATNCGNSRSYLNPVTEGRVIVRIESRFAGAWGEYFSERTQGEVTYPDEDLVIVELVALGNIGQFQMPAEGGSITVPGASNGHSTPEFTFRMRPDDADSADFSNLQWSLFVDEGDNHLEVHLEQDGGGSPCPGTGVEGRLYVYYSDDGGDNYQGWESTDTIEAECADLDGDGDEEIYMDVDLVTDQNDDGNYTEIEGGDVNMTYTSIGSGRLVSFSPDDLIDTATSPTLDGHGDFWEPETVSAGDELTTDQLINHYFAELPEDFELTVDDKNSDTVNEDASSGYLDTTGDGSYVTYLHVTRNEVDVRLRSA